ncbi:NAD(P)H-hydrate dehydratase [Hydrogenimonas cancrithermarum]|uniref:Bifunctional NAD(P)H-hydrate repair enzyme n=1 Tax=Hydrogenimonas cancrithermarum TaxID=2993563 RepID=A0ABM8FNQ5_9BACT|nr:NAD(P)H-hydrate dehydratase [Hydrogenimonas cancrithermarum]BDY13194.1 bifunctional NAD(P)H-hydrate repair enzyme [Hydrogenimonas cancrithermarum]
MQKVFNNCYDLDRRCYEKFGLTEDILMEHAAEGMARHIRDTCGDKEQLLIAAGPGNNGADGITLARLLHGDFDVSLYLPYGAKSAMAKIQLERFLQLGAEPVQSPPLQADIVVDTLFGTGFAKPLDTKGIDLVDSFNGMEAYKIACDVPTGIDPNGNPNPIAFHADTTITMGALKKALFSDHAKPYVGRIEVVDLGISRTHYEHHTDAFLLTQEDFTPPLRTNAASHKGTFGHLCVIAGKKRGAAVLCGSAALRFGAGLVTLISDRNIDNLPFSLMQSGDLPDTTSAIAMGMGMGYDYDPILIKTSIVEDDIPILMDADMCYVPWIRTLLEKCSKTVVTPHPKEFSVLLKTLEIDNVTVSEIQRDRFGWAKRFSEAYPKTVLLLKGANTLIAHEGIIYINPLGTPVLSQAGSGDILSGLIASLMAQGYTPLNAAINGSLAHALSARRYKGANFSATAEDLIEEIRWLVN